MDIVLPKIHDDQKFLEYASEIQYDEFNAKMFVFYTSSSDVDIYQLIADDRLVQLIFGWDACRVHTRESITEDVSYIVKVLAHHTLQIWFGQEWIGSAESLKRMLLFYLSKATAAFAKIEGLCDIEWQYMLNFETNPWRVPYLQGLFANLLKNKHHVIEHSVAPATEEDVTFFRQERLHLIILRLVKLFDAGSFEAVKQLSLRILAAWLKCNASATCGILEEEQSSISLVGHLYLLTVFTADDNRGYVIDNMMYNIRFYAQSMQEASHEADYTPARLIAQVCVRLGLGKEDFFGCIVVKKFNLSMVTSFAVMLKAYTSYVLGNQLMGLMGLNQHDFMDQLDQFKDLIRRYIKEREDSEEFLLNELQKLESQRNSHASPHSMNMKLNYQQQICKGNRASNIGNYKNCDDDEKPQVDVDEELDRQIDPVFQNVPNNEEVLDFVHQLLAERSFRGWQFAKIALLLKIIGQKLNTIEVWRYHPGLTEQFMLNLEHNLSVNYADLAKVFSEHCFMESEFWLTAFYLNPTRLNYEQVKRCSRFKKRRKEEDEHTPRKESSRAEKPDPTKYELLSSTIDVDEIVAVTNHNAPVTDYDPICKALKGLRLPRSMIKDLLTVAFQPRNKRYSWALEWSALHQRCSELVKSTDLKKKFVALNMAEANDRLKFLKIDYAKYKNRPQLDYGTIEEGYENAVGTAEMEVELSAEEDEEALKKAAQEKAERERERKRRRNPRKFWDEVVTEDEEEEEQVSDDSEAFYTGSGRRTRVRAAAVVANAMITDMDRAMRSGRRSPPPPSAAAIAAAAAVEQAAAEVPTLETDKPNAAPEEPSPQKRSFGEILQTQAKYSNETNGFKAFVDIWNFEKDELISAENDNKLMESNSLLSKFRNLQGLKKRAIVETKTMDCGGNAAVDDELRRFSTNSEAGNELRRFSTNSEADSLHSGTSTMALHDASELDEGQSGVSKELTPPPRTSDFTKETQVLQLRKQYCTKDDDEAKTLAEAATTTASDVETVTATATATARKSLRETELQTNTDQVQDIETPRMGGIKLEQRLDEELEESQCKGIKSEQESCTESQGESQSKRIKSEQRIRIKSERSSAENHERESASGYKSSETSSAATEKMTRNSSKTTMDLHARLIQECLTRQVEVRLDRLTTQDIEHLRGVRVLVKRTNFREYYREHSSTMLQVHERPDSRGRRSRTHTEDSNASTTTSETRRRKTKRFVHITSDTPVQPTRSINAKPRFKQLKQLKRFKQITSDSSTSTDPEEAVRPPSMRRRRGPKSCHTAFKIKKVKLQREVHVTGDSDVIELSSDSLSSSSSPVPVPRSVNRFPEVAMPMELDPLYEEEIVPF